MMTASLATGFAARIKEATRLTRAGRLVEATALLRSGSGEAKQPAREATTTGPVIDGVAEASPTAAFTTRHFANAHGSRDYKLYVPGSYRGDPVPLIVMLHGCTQSPDDFAAGTRMNAAAERHGFLVAYPAQTRAANAQGCWNWFRDEDQRRDRGEPSLIAGITREVADAFAVQRDRIYVAGLSAGGAAAAIMAAAYPDLYAAAGIHSGLAVGSASNVSSALQVMRDGAARTPVRERAGRRVPTILFHGDRDTTVDPRNGDAIVAQIAAGDTLVCREDEGRSGHTWRCRHYAEANGRVVIEQWLVHGAGHAWFGGDSAGSFTDPSGPDATEEMIRFFLSASVLGPVAD